MSASRPPPKRRRQTGFTLVELMVVVALVVIIAAVAARYSRKSSSGDQTAEVARALMIAANEARQSALTFGRDARLRVDIPQAGKPPLVYTERLDSSNAWVGLGSAIRLPTGVDLCTVQNQPVLGTGAATNCPTTTKTRICFGPNGKVEVPNPDTSDTCTFSAAGSGATLYLQSKYDGSNPKQFKLVLFRLTGMARLSDKW